MVELLKIILLGIIEGVTEWLPVSSTGHMLLVDEFIRLNASKEFKDVFFILIQLGAILAVIVLFFGKMWPFKRKNSEIPGDTIFKKNTWMIWFKVVVACIPGAVVTLLFDDLVDEYLETPVIIAIALVFYGILFIIIENWNKKRVPVVASIDEITFKQAFVIGLFQVLSIIPGTSRSGATIIGALIIGISRVAAAEFTFFMAVPVMVGYSLLKLIKYGFAFSTTEYLYLGLSMVVAFVTSILVIKFLMGYIKKNDFKFFGYYRIVLGIMILLYFLIIK